MKGCIIAVAVAATLIACGSSRSPVDIVTDGGVVSPGNYKDPFEHLQRLDTSSFIEITEVRARDDGIVLFCSGVKGLNVVDAANPSDMKLIDRLQSRLGSGQYPRCQHVAYSGDIVYMVNRGDEIQPTPFIAAFDLSDGGTEVANYIEDGVSFEGAVADGDYLYVATHADGLFVLRRNGGSIEKLSTVGGFDNAWAVAKAGDSLFVADAGGALRVIDVANPASPAVVGEVAIDGPAQSVEIEGNYAYVAAGQGGLSVVDISDRTAPAVVAVADTPGTTLQVALGGNGYAYVADWNDVRVYDISTPSAPALVAAERIEVTSGFPRVLGLGARGEVAFAGEWAGLHSLRLLPERTAPDLWFGDRELDFGEVAAGEADAIAVVIENQGTERLAIWAIETSDARFTVDRRQLVLQPGQIKIVELQFRPDSSAQIDARLDLWSDDPDEQLRSIALSGNRPGAGVGDEAPDVVVQLLGGGEWKLSDSRGDVVLLAYFATF